LKIALVFTNKAIREKEMLSINKNKSLRGKDAEKC
jgi:hypothetical protein